MLIREVVLRLAGDVEGSLNMMNMKRVEIVRKDIAPVVARRKHVQGTEAWKGVAEGALTAVMIISSMGRVHPVWCVWLVRNWP